MNVAALALLIAAQSIRPGGGGGGGGDLSAACARAGGDACRMGGDIQFGDATTWIGLDDDNPFAVALLTFDDGSGAIILKDGTVLVGGGAYEVVLNSGAASGFLVSRTAGSGDVFNLTGWPAAEGWWIDGPGTNPGNFASRNLTGTAGTAFAGSYELRAAASTVPVFCAGVRVEETSTNADCRDAFYADGRIDLEGDTADDFEVTLDPGDPTADYVITLPNATGTVALTSNTWTRVEKTADQSKTADTTFADDSALLFAMDANAVYSIRLVLWIVVGASATPDFKWQLAGPAAPTAVSVVCGRGSSTVSWSDSFAVNTGYTGLNASPVDLGASGAGAVTCDIRVHNGANAGNLTVQWAQNASDAAATTLRAGSFIEYRKVQ